MNILVGRSFFILKIPHTGDTEYQPLRIVALLKKILFTQRKEKILHTGDIKSFDQCG